MLEKRKPQEWPRLWWMLFVRNFFLKVLLFRLFLNILEMSQWLVGHHGQNMMNVYV